MTDIQHTPCGIQVVTEEDYQKLLQSGQLNPNAYYYIRSTRTLYRGKTALTPVFKTVETLNEVTRLPGHFFLEESSGAILFCPDNKKQNDFYIFPVHHGVENVKRYVNVIMDQVTLLDLMHDYYPTRFWYTGSLSAVCSTYAIRQWPGEDVELFWTDSYNRDGEYAWKRTVLVRCDPDLHPASIVDAGVTIIYDSATKEGDQWNIHQYTPLHDKAFIDHGLDSTKRYRYAWFSQDVLGNWITNPDADKVVEIIDPEYQDSFANNQETANFLQRYYHKERYNGQ